VKEARIQLGVGSEKYEFTLKGDSFHFQTLRLPAGIREEEEEEKDPGGQVLERIYLVEKALKIVDQLFSLFLKRRLSPQWSSEEVRQIKKWLAQ